MAVVYLAHDEELRRLVAIKVLAEHLSGDSAFRERFLQESRLASRLSHPNVVQVYDAGEADGRPYIVMEYVEGDTLAERGKLAYEDAVPLALQACAGLQHAHAAHAARDRPRNRGLPRPRAGRRRRGHRCGGRLLARCGALRGPHGTPALRVRLATRTGRAADERSDHTGPGPRAVGARGGRGGSDARAGARP